jgi:cytochrome c5
MLRNALLVLSIAFMSACGEETPPSTQSEPTVDPRSPDQEDSAVLGYVVYEHFCASCHETGAGGAPVTGEPADWTDRSELWVAVLTEHVKAGYLSMPARGAEPELTDLSVGKAVEHMMLITFPEKTRD